MRVNTYILCFQFNELYWHGTLYVLPKHNRNDEKKKHSRFRLFTQNLYMTPHGTINIQPRAQQVCFCCFSKSEIAACGANAERDSF